MLLSVLRTAIFFIFSSLRYLHICTGVNVPATYVFYWTVERLDLESYTWYGVDDLEIHANCQGCRASNHIKLA
jgi:hypothetical protein